MSNTNNADEASSTKKSTVTFTTEAEEVIPSIAVSVNIETPATAASGSPNWEQDAEQDNPQEAYSPASEEIAPIAEEPDEEEEETNAHLRAAAKTKKKRPKPKKGWRRRKRGRDVRIAAVADSESTPKTKKMPASHFETVLRRRAIRKEAAVLKNVPSPSRRGIFGSTSRVSEKEVAECKDFVEGYDEEIGDTSLGMKLNIIGGRVIVQGVNALGDGRASPAQLSGMVKRGDVLLSVDNKSIVNLPLDQLVVGLKPLSTAQPDGSYKRSLKLRFAAGDGLRVLNKNDDKAKAAIKTPEVFSFNQFLPQDFPMADQLSGLPMFDDPPSAMKPKILEPVIAIATAIGSEEEKSNGQDRRLLSLNDFISIGIAELLHDEKQRFMSEYFSWNENLSELLRPSIVVTAKAAEEITAFLNRKELIARGEEAMKGAKQLSYNLEDIDKGKDLRSLKAWSSNASLRSRASARRRYVMEAASVIGSTIMEEADSDMAVSVGSDELDEMDGLDGDELLTQLAAYDEIWRQQVLETITKATEEMEAGRNDEETEANTSVARNNDIAEKLSSLFLGEHVNNLFSKKKKTYALPSDEVTCVLFDLVTHLASTTPDEISVKGKFEINPQTSLVPFQRSKNPTVDKDALLATLFVVNEVFPAWLKSFKPLPWAERRVLWPHTKASTMESSAGSSLGDDLLTLDSAGVPASPLRAKKKNLRETIEDMELDVESRAEACFLITFYFTQEILPGMGAKGPLSAGWRNKKVFTEEDALDFVDLYGAYLRLPMALAYAAFLKSELVVVKLLELAKHDPRHAEALKDISKVNALVLYEPTMLSAITKCVRTIGAQRIEGRNHLIHLAVSAFPDVRPWLVRKGCLGDDSDGSSVPNEDLEELYYVYLSLLLHPSHGHEAARQDMDLVKEWCSLSVASGVTDDAYRRSRKGNFMVVASRKQPEYKSYRRDVPFLLDLAVEVNEIELALELIDEMLCFRSYVINDELTSTIVSHLRLIVKESLTATPMNGFHLQRAFRMFEKMSAAQEHCGVQNFVSVSTEYSDVINSCNSQDRKQFLELLASEAEPLFALQSLHSWSNEHKSGAEFLPLLHLSLMRSATLRERKELSPALLRIEKARSSDQEERKDENGHTDLTTEDERQSGTLWRLMMSGDLEIDK